MDTVYSEKFFDQLRDAVAAVRVAAGERETARPGSAASYRAALDHRRLRDEVGSLVARHPEEFAGLVIAIAQDATESWARLNDRVARLEAAMEELS